MIVYVSVCEIRNYGFRSQLHTPVFDGIFLYVPCKTCEQFYGVLQTYSKSKSMLSVTLAPFRSKHVGKLKLLGSLYQNTESWYVY